MSVHNGERYLREAIDSILSQTHENLEFIIVDDGSTDGTADIIRSYSDVRIRNARNQQNLGLTKSLNKGIALAHGEYIARQDADDVSEPDRLERQLDVIEADRDLVLLGTWSRDIDEHGRVVGHFDLPLDHESMLGNALNGMTPVRHPSILVRRSALEKIGGYADEFPFAQDLDLILRIAEVGRVGNIRDRLLRYRVHEYSITTAQGNTQVSCAREICNRARQLRGMPDLEKSFQPHRLIQSPAEQLHSVTWIASWAAENGYNRTAFAYLVKAFYMAPLNKAVWRAAAKFVLPIRIVRMIQRADI